MLRQKLSFKSHTFLLEIPVNNSLFLVVCWKYPGVEILSPLITDFEIAARTADLERAKNKDYEQDIFVLAVSQNQVYTGTSSGL